MEIKTVIASCVLASMPAAAQAKIAQNETRRALSTWTHDLEACHKKVLLEYEEKACILINRSKQIIKMCSMKELRALICGFEEWVKSSDLENMINAEDYQKLIDLIAQARTAIISPQHLRPVSSILGIVRYPRRLEPCDEIPLVTDTQNALHDFLITL